MCVRARLNDIAETGSGRGNFPLRIPAACLAYFSNYVLLGLVVSYFIVVVIILVLFCVSYVV